MHWLARPLAYSDQVFLPPIDPDALSDSDLRVICLRMTVILDTIESRRCEGRLLPTKLFDQIDTLESMVLHGHGGAPRLSDWETLLYLIKTVPSLSQ